MACTLAGCSRQMNPAQSKALVDGKVQVGMSRAETESLVGFPQKIEKVGATTFFYYAPSWYIPSFTVGQRTPIAFMNGKVVGIGKAYYDSIVASADTTAASN